MGQALARQAGLVGLVVEVTANASDEGNLYGSIGTREISAAAEALGHEINKSEILMGEGPIRTVGEFDVVVHLHTDVEAVIKVIVHPE